MILYINHIVREGVMNLDKIKRLATDLLKDRKAHIQREKGGVLYHGQRTAQIALQLRKILLPEDSSHDDILKVAAWFHDCSKGIEPHANYGAIIAKETLKDYVSSHELEKIYDLIQLHPLRDPNNNNYDDYTKLLQDADHLDHFGTPAIWINIQYQAYVDGTMQEMLDFFNINNEAFHNKHRALLNYDLSKRIFDDKVAFERKYITRLNDEGIGKIHNLKELL
jgi:uncharacterized protein